MPEHPLEFYRNRNRAIVADYVAGLTPYGLAEKYRLSERRVRSILLEHGFNRRIPRTKRTSGQILLDLGLDRDLVSLEICRANASV